MINFLLQQRDGCGCFSCTQTLHALGMAAPLLTEVMPKLAQELETLLAEVGESELVAQVQQLRIVDRCRCGGDFCATFYTVPLPNGAWSAGHRNVWLGCQTGMLILDVVDAKVTAVEVLHRDEIRQRLNEILSLNDAA